MTTIISNTSSDQYPTTFEISVSSATFKFNAAHFVAYRNFRERLHGHNYTVSVRLLGGKTICNDGYVLDFGCVKAVTKKICKELNEHFICPVKSDVMTITTVKNEGDNGEYIQLKCEDGSVFLMPKKDCAMLPIAHSTTEELAIYLWGRILNGLNAEYLIRRGVHTLEVTVAEAVGQEAVFRLKIPKEGLVDNDERVNVEKYISNGDIVPMPCPTETEAAYDAACDSAVAAKVKEVTATAASTDISNKKRKHEGNGECCANCKSTFTQKLQKLADSINSGKLKEMMVNGGKVDVQDLEATLDEL